MSRRCITAAPSQITQRKALRHTEGHFYGDAHAGCGRRPQSLVGRVKLHDADTDAYSDRVSSCMSELRGFNTDANVSR